MSLTGRKVFATAIGNGTDDNGNPVLYVNYKYGPRYEHPGGYIDGGQVSVSMLNRTESEINSDTQAVVLEACNRETEYAQGFLLTDITGGRI